MCNLHNCSFYPLIKGVNYFLFRYHSNLQVVHTHWPLSCHELMNFFLSIFFSSIAIHHTQLFAIRGKFVKPGLEDRWKGISFHFMTEESGGESLEEIVRHELPWRSEGELHCNYIHHLHKYI